MKIKNLMTHLYNNQVLYLNACTANKYIPEYYNKTNEVDTLDSDFRINQECVINPSKHYWKHIPSTNQHWTHKYPSIETTGKYTCLWENCDVLQQQYPDFKYLLL